jgi:putative peptidoglycan lipid II flippase
VSAEPSPSAIAPSPADPPKARPAAGAGRGAAMVTAGIVLSRFAGLLRQIVSAHFFGTSGFADVLRVSFQVGNITQNLLGEGTLSASFIPVYAKLRGQGRASEATHFALSALGLLLATVAAASLLGVLFAPQLSALIAGGFDAQKLETTARVVRVAFPMTGLLATSAWALGVLNAHHRFFLPYAAPVLWSLAQIAATIGAGVFFHARGESLAMAVAWGALVGAALQLLVLLPAARKLLGGLRPRLDTRDPGVREASRRLPGALLGRGVIQLSGLVDAYLVSFVGTGANAIFGYAQTIYLLPMALLGTGEAAAALPDLARDTAEQDVERRNRIMRDRLGASLARVTTLTIPTTAGFALLGGELVTVLLQTGQFDRSSTAEVRPVLAVYGLALLANAAGRVLTTTSYALGDTRAPATYAVYRVVASAAVAIALLRHLGVLGVVLGAVVAAWIELVALGLRVRRAIGGLGLSQIPLARILVLTVVSVGAGVALRAMLPAAFVAHRPGAALVLVAAGGAFSITASALGLFDVRSLLRRR